jgi:hypothetical protein
MRSRVPTALGVPLHGSPRSPPTQVARGARDGFSALSTKRSEAPRAEKPRVATTASGFDRQLRVTIRAEDASRRYATPSVPSRARVSPITRMVLRDPARRTWACADRRASSGFPRGVAFAAWPRPSAVLDTSFQGDRPRWRPTTPRAFAPAPDRRSTVYALCEPARAGAIAAARRSDWGSRANPYVSLFAEGRSPPKPRDRRANARAQPGGSQGGKPPR